MKHLKKNLAASVRDRLSNLARTDKEDFQELLSRYARERLLYRLSISNYKNELILKGAILFSYWIGSPHRPTRDLDLEGHGLPDIARMADLIRKVCKTAVEPDGLVFQVESLEGLRIRADEDYEGVRLRLTAMLGEVRIPLQIDIGFGDRIVPGPVEIEFPTILDFPAPIIQSYTRESVVAEKFEAMVKLGIVNSRMKDFFDLWHLSKRFSFDGILLGKAIEITFATRGTRLPVDLPFAFTHEFSADVQKRNQWSAFLNKSRLKANVESLSDVIEDLTRFLMPLVVKVAVGDTFAKKWSSGGPWE